MKHTKCTEIHYSIHKQQISVGFLGKLYSEKYVFPRGTVIN